MYTTNIGGWAGINSAYTNALTKYKTAGQEDAAKLELAKAISGAAEPSPNDLKLAGLLLKAGKDNGLTADMIAAVLVFAKDNAEDSAPTISKDDFFRDGKLPKDIAAVLVTLELLASADNGEADAFDALYSEVCEAVKAKPLAEEIAKELKANFPAKTTILDAIGKGDVVAQEPPAPELPGLAPTARAVPSAPTTDAKAVDVIAGIVGNSVNGFGDQIKFAELMLGAKKVGDKYELGGKTYTAEQMKAIGQAFMQKVINVINDQTLKTNQEKITALCNFFESGKLGDVVIDEKTTLKDVTFKGWTGSPNGFTTWLKSKEYFGKVGAADGADAILEQFKRIAGHIGAWDADKLGKPGFPDSFQYYDSYFVKSPNMDQAKATEITGSFDQEFINSMYEKLKDTMFKDLFDVSALPKVTLKALSVSGGGNAVDAGKAEALLSILMNAYVDWKIVKLGAPVEGSPEAKQLQSFITLRSTTPATTWENPADAPEVWKKGLVGGPAVRGYDAVALAAAMKMGAPAAAAAAPALPKAADLKASAQLIKTSGLPAGYSIYATPAPDNKLYLVGAADPVTPIVFDQATKTVTVPIGPDTYTIKLNDDGSIAATNNVSVSGATTLLTMDLLRADVNSLFPASKFVYDQSLNIYVDGSGAPISKDVYESALAAFLDKIKAYSGLGDPKYQLAQIIIGLADSYFELAKGSGSDSIRTKLQEVVNALGGEAFLSLVLRPADTAQGVSELTVKQYLEKNYTLTIDGGKKVILANKVLPDAPLREEAPKAPSISVPGLTLPTGNAVVELSAVGNKTVYNALVDTKVLGPVDTWTQFGTSAWRYKMVGTTFVFSYSEAGKSNKIRLIDTAAAGPWAFTMEGAAMQITKDASTGAFSIGPAPAAKPAAETAKNIPPTGATLYSLPTGSVVPKNWSIYKATDGRLYLVHKTETTISPQLLTINAKYDFTPTTGARANYVWDGSKFVDQSPYAPGVEVTAALAKEPGKFNVDAYKVQMPPRSGKYSILDFVCADGTTRKVQWNGTKLVFVAS